jgi:hypothetical protein
MRSLAALLSVSLSAGCLGGPLTTSMTATSPSPVPDVFACTRQQLKALDFDQSSLDVKENRVTARQYDETVRRPDVRFRRIVNRLEIEVVPASSGGLTQLTINAGTFAELATQRGPTEEQERTSDAVRTAAQTIVKKCGGAVDSLSVPS